jgi:glycolate oxidase FAD binding subunit
MATFQVSSEADVVEVVRGAREGGGTLEIVGHGTKRGLGRPVECDDVLDLSGLSGIVSYEPDEMIVTARAGTPVAEIESALAEHNQRLGFEPADWGPLFGAAADSSTIGGVLSADANGSAAVRYGRCRDHLLGFRAVNGFGEAYKGGGKVVKNVTGFDLPKLFCGAMGTLGPLTEFTLRVFPRPEQSICFLVSDVDRFAGLGLLRRLWRSPLEATGLAHIPGAIADGYPELGDFGRGAALIRLEGSPTVLTEKAVQLSGMIKDERLAEIGNGSRLFGKIAGGEVGPTRTNWDIWRVYATPFMLQDYEESVREDDVRPPRIVDWAGGVMWCASTAGLDLRTVPAVGLQHTLARASSETRRHILPFTPEDRVRAGLTQRVKAAFDPLRLFNPGRMWEGV